MIKDEWKMYKNDWFYINDDKINYLIKKIKNIYI